MLQTPYRDDKQAYSDLEQVRMQMAQKNFCFIPAEQVRSLLQQQQASALQDWSTFQNSWSDLALDTYMADQGSYRKRKHATLSAPAASRLWQKEAHQPHYQSLTYNNLNGGIARHYAPISDAVMQSHSMNNLLTLACDIFGQLMPEHAWHIEAHQFRIEANAEQAGLPTPEGVHRDGVNFVMMLMVQRANMVNGATTIYDLNKNRLDQFVLTNPLDMALVNDEQVFHGVTPIMQLDSDRLAARDVLVITFRRKTQSPTTAD
ncbi:2OG-Fe dioxygenase family protein [Iodobacter sp. CM08]|uniref:2OG-Fe dioxygenase family protein n=1 Tax=Iodobacter sp. CM08 TaxID=3085902 RepID=UPI0029815338|nr:2OG-Fe dioxygenase family protein [Iodobacter sp. CM08]MDW5417195.1 2OG-Fe dioxygenase family protein [Iodobacter sp. CM08]